MTMSLRDDIAALRYAIEALVPAMQALAPVPPTEHWKIGALFFSTLPDNPHDQLGYGEWQPFGLGRVIVCVDPDQPEFAAPELTGGEKTHALTVDELAEHAHDSPPHAHPLESRTAITGAGSTYEFGAIDTTSTGALEGLGVGEAAAVVEPAGGGQPHNNLQPFITAYVWQRVS